jgi:hypothetical protein
MLGRHERHRRRARGDGRPVKIAIRPWAVPAFLATDVLRQSADSRHFACRAWQGENVVEFANCTDATPGCLAVVPNEVGQP